MSNLELYKKMYYYELDTKEKINLRISTPLAGVALFISGLGYFIKYINKTENAYIYYFLLIIYAISLIAIIIFILRAFFGYSYKCIVARDILDFDLEIEKYYDENYEEYFAEKGIKKNELKEIFFQNNLNNRYADAATYNMAQNTKKLGYFRIIGWICVITLIDTFLIFIFLAFYKII